MITLYEMFESLPKSLIESDLDGIFQVLLRRSLDTNLFVGEEAEKTLTSLCRNLPEQKLLHLLLANRAAKSSVLRC
jgi:hypothetical protein